MVREIRGRRLLEGYRGSPVVDVAGLKEILHRVSLLAMNHPEIAELDLNPVLAFPGREPALALDARLKVSAAAGAPVPA